MSPLLTLSEEQGIFFLISPQKTSLKFYWNKLGHIPICETILLPGGMPCIDLLKSELLVARIGHLHWVTTIMAIPKLGQGVNYIPSILYIKR